MGRQARQWIALSLLGLLRLVSCNCNRHSPITALDGLDFSDCTAFPSDLTISSITLPTRSQGVTPTLTLTSLQTVKGSLVIEDIRPNSEGTGPNQFAISAPVVTGIAGGLRFSNLSDALVPSFPRLRSAEALNFSNITFKAPNTLNTELGDFHSLAYVGNLNFTNTTISQIGQCNGTVSCITLSKLQYDEGGVHIEGNNHLNSVNLPLLYNASSIGILNNPHLHRVSLPKLRRVGTLNVSGPVNEVSIPNLRAKGVANSVNVHITPSGDFNCDSILLPSSIYDCPAGTLTSPNGGAPSSSNSAAAGGGGSGSGSGNNNNGGGLSKGAQIGLGVGLGVGLALLLLLLALILFCIRRRRKSKLRRRSVPAGGGYSKAEEVSNSDGRPRSDYYNNNVYGAAGTGRNSHHDSSNEKAVGNRGIANPEQWEHRYVGDRQVAVPEWNYRDISKGEYRDRDAAKGGYGNVPRDGGDKAETRSLEYIERMHQSLNRG